MTRPSGPWPFPARLPAATPTPSPSPVQVDMEPQDEPSALKQCRADGRCQYAIDHGAEGLGHCPAGKCCMPDYDEHRSEMDRDDASWCADPDTGDK